MSNETDFNFAVREFGAGNYLKAAKLFENIANLGMPSAYLHAARAFSAGGDEKAAAQNWQSLLDSASAGDPASMFAAHLVRRVDSEVMSLDLVTSKVFLERAAEQGFAPAMLQLADDFKTGLHTGSHNPKMYEHWITTAAKSGVDEAVCSYAEYLNDSRMNFPDWVKARLETVPPFLRERADKIVRRARRIKGESKGSGCSQHINGVRH